MLIYSVTIREVYVYVCVCYRDAQKEDFPTKGWPTNSGGDTRTPQAYTHIDTAIHIFPYM